MNKYIKMMTAGVMLTGMLSLAACSSGGSEAASPPPSAPPSASPAPATSAPSPEASDAAPPTAVSPAPGGGMGQNTAAQLTELLELAKQGKAPGLPFAAHTDLIDDVKKAWGEPDKEEGAGQGIYATYSAKHAVIGFNKGSLIFDVRSSAAELQQLTLEQIEETLGKPDDVKTSGNDSIYIYKAGEQFQLKFVIPQSTGKVDHISVFSEQDSINNMAG
ncbi:YjgB family protein [Paenibacillus forsythiae]